MGIWLTATDAQTLSTNGRVRAASTGQLDVVIDALEEQAKTFGLLTTKTGFKIVAKLAVLSGVAAYFDLDGAHESITQGRRSAKYDTGAVQKKLRQGFKGYMTGVFGQFTEA